MHKKLISHAVQAALFSSALAIPEFTLAEEAKLEEVVVVARRRSEDLQQVPIAVTAFTSNEIQSAGISRPQDFISLTPNVSIVDTANAGDTQVTIRGQYSTRDAESTFAYVVDGVLITNPNGFNGELYDIEQIEVLKGPQGAIYGRNAVSGAIIVNTKRPTKEFEASAKGTLGDDNLKKGQAMVSGPLIDDQLYGRLTMFYGKSDGQFENKFTGQDDQVNYSEEQAARGRLIWEPTDKLTVDTIGSYREVKGGAINFNAVFALPVAAEYLGNSDLYGDVNRHNFKYIFNVPGENKQEDTFFSVKSDYEMNFATLTVTAAYDDMKEYLLSDGTSAAFGGYSLGAEASQTACTQTYNNFDTSLLQSPFYAIQDGLPPGVYVPEYGGLNGLLPPYSPTTCDGYQYQQRDQKSTSLEARLTSNEDGKLRWLAGVYYADIERTAAVGYGADLGLGFRRTIYIPPSGPNPTDQLFWDKFNTDVYAAFGQVELDVSEKGELALALRYDKEDRAVDNKVPNVLNAQIFGQFGRAPINPAYDGSLTDTIPNRDKSFSEWQPKISYTYKFTDEFNGYASYGVGFRSGGFNNIGSAATINNAFGTYETAPKNIRDNYDKETTDTYELGFKSQWLDNSLRINGATFYTEVDDYQFFNFFAGPFGLLRVVSNIDKVEIYGAEIDFAWALNNYLTFSGGYGAISSEIKQNTNRPYTEGNDLPYAPDGSGALSLDFSMPVFGNLEWMTRLDFEYVGKTWFHSVQEDTTVNFFTDLSNVYGVPGFGFGPSEYSNTERDAYWKLNLRAGISGEHWSLEVWSKNLTDEQYLEEIIPAPEFGGSFIHDSAGRISGVDLTYTF
ncbi:MAG: TonB-dependent receptor [Gammaproteobacteria bacterium]|nr:TonB-dependent receptor [Gammaproteobacteria bacterium]MDH5171602.1 TonB-dependent receptor [Gammaproteobacteria bacterium]